jgi:hypothetical protein
MRLDGSGAAIFSGSVTARGPKSQIVVDGNSVGAGISLTNTIVGANRRNWGIFTEENVEGDFVIERSTTSGGTPNTAVLSLSRDGAATFSSSVTATQVSIGTTSPATFLHVNGATAALPNASGTTQSAGNRIRLSTAAGTSILDIGCAGGTGMWLQSTDLTDLNLKYPILLNPNGGNVGIGTSSPVYKLVVSNNGAEGFEFIPAFGTNINVLQNYNRATATWGTFDVRANDYVFRNQGTAALTITSGGNVGIGTSSPQGALSVKVGLYRQIDFVEENDSMTLKSTAPDGGYNLRTLTSTGNELYFRTGASSGTASTERMRITSGGDLLVGATSSTYSASGRGLIVANGSSTSLYGWAVGGVSKGYLYHEGTNVYIENAVSGGNLYVVSGASGGVYLASGGTSWTSSSDERLKTDLIPIEDAVNKVSSLRSVIGRYKIDEEGTKRSFLIAQDVLKVLPEAVNINNETGDLGISYTEVIPLLVAAIKELKLEIEQLKNK